MKKIIIISSACLFCMIGNANAAENNLTVSCSDEKIIIRGNGEIAENELISIVCVDSIDDLNELDDDNIPHFIEAINAEEYEINAILNIPDNMNGGKYYIAAQGENYCASAYFVYVDERKVELALEKINSAQSPEALGKVLKDEDVDLDDEIYDSNSELINVILYTGKGKGYDTEGFMNVLYESYFASLICEGKSEEAFGVYCKDDVLSEKYNNLINIPDFEEIFKNSEFEKYAVSTLSDMAIMASKVKIAENWKEIRNEILQNDSSTPSEKVKEYFDFSYYSELKDKNSVFQKMAEKISGIKSFSELKKLFEDTTKDIYESENKKNKGQSSGGGSSSGGGVSGGMYSPVIPEQIKQENLDEILFSDIENHWAKEDIVKLNRKGIINGYEDKTFRPNKYVTRAEMVKMICLAFSLTGNGEMNFNDVSENDWYYQYINCAYTNGIVNGNGDGFSPNEYITREDATVIMYRILSKNYPIESATLTFIDKSDISDYAKDAIGAMKNEGIIEGVGKNKFEPKSPITRAQCATLINRCILRFEITE